MKINESGLLEFMTDLLAASLDGAQVLLYLSRASNPLLVADLVQPDYTGYAPLTPAFVGPRVFPAGQVGATAVAEFTGTGADPQLVQGFAITDAAGVNVMGWEDFSSARLVGDALHPVEVLVNLWLDPDADYGNGVIG